MPSTMQLFNYNKYFLSVPHYRYVLWMAATLKCLVLHLSRNLSLLHRRVTLRLGAIMGGSGSPVRRRKLMVRRTMVTRW